MATFSITITEGICNINVKQYRNGNMIFSTNVQQTTTDNIDTASGDIISFGGVCSGTTVIEVSAATIPTTPVQDPEGPVNHTLIIV